MAKRRLSRQQRERIRAAQDAQLRDERLQQGVVVSHQGGQVLVELERGSTVDCKIKSNLGSLVCGDRVGIESPRAGEHRIVAILPRDNLLRRVDGFGKVRPVAANISQLIVCLAVTPEPNLYLLDQYLLSAEQQAIEASILLNKIDLAANIEDPFELEKIYRPLGYRILHTSVKTGTGMDEFSSILAGQLSVLSGVSGVGKSSLTAWLLPGEEIKIAEISATSAEGRHTTRSSRLYHLPGGGDLIDTPGVRGFTPFIDSESPVSAGFREIDEYSAECRFHNCLHRNEPACAVIDGVEAGRIDTRRYQSYLKLLAQANPV